MSTTLLEQLDMPNGCMLEIKEIMNRAGCQDPITIQRLYQCADLINRQAGGSTRAALRDALKKIGHSYYLVNKFKKDTEKHSGKPKKEIPTINASDLGGNITISREKANEVKQMSEIERIDQKIELLKKLKVNLEENREICERLAKL